MNPLLNTLFQALIIVTVVSVGLASCAIVLVQAVFTGKTLRRTGKFTDA